MKSREEDNEKQKRPSSNKIKKRKKLSTKSPANKSEDTISFDKDSCANKSQINRPADTKPGLTQLNESVLENQGNNKQTESTNSVKIKLKRGRKSNKDRLQISSLNNLGRNQSDLQSFVQRRTEQSEESKANADVSQVSKEEENSFSEKHIKNKKHQKHKKHKNHKDQEDGENISNSTINDIVNDNIDKIVLTEQKNAFKVMMEGRNKVIGKNSPGKDSEINEIQGSIAENKLKLSARKSLLQEWADAKGGLKRKFEDAEKQLCINKKLEIRAKRMKKMLSLSLSDKNKDSSRVSKRKQVRKIISDSDSDDDLNKKIIHISEDSEHYESDTERQVNVIKIKMFSPEVFKRRQRKKQDNRNGDLKNNKKIVDDKAAKSIEIIDEGHKIKEITNTALDQKENSNNETINLRRSSRKSTKINYNNSDLISLTSKSEESSDSDTVDESKSKERRNLKKMKVAPVFLRATPKPKIDPAIIEARKQFLMSGVPESLRRIIEKQQTLDDVGYDVFPTVSHIQQKTLNKQNLMNYWSLPPANLNFTDFKPYTSNLKEISLLPLLNYTRNNHEKILESSVTEMMDFKSILKDIKTRHPDYPVFKTFRLLREKFELCHAVSRVEKTSIRKKQSHKRKPQQLNDKEDKTADEYVLWTEKFKAQTSNDIIGNRAGMSEIKKWLISWEEYIRETKLLKTGNSSSSDFDSSDGESSNSRKIPTNAIILIGPHGSGKTMTIYAICNELHINVLELNASDKRTGKRLLQKLQEATQSHQVRKNESANSSQNDLNHQTKNDKMCLLVLDDIDVIFDQDEGFLSALTQLLQTSKRPIVLVTTDENCSHLQKFIVQYPIIRFTGLSANVLSVWLQILCLIEGIKIDEEMVAELLERNKGDARQTLLQLQFWMQDSDRKLPTLRGSAASFDGNNLNKEEKCNYSLNDIPENDLQEIVVHSNHKQLFVNETLTLENVWWSLSSFLNISPMSHSYNCNDQTQKEDEEFYVLHKCKKVFDTFAMSDFVCTKLNLDCSTEPSPKMFQQNSVKDSMELIENMNTYNDSKEVVTDWTNYLLSKQLDMQVESQNKSTCLTSQERRWRSKRYNCEKKFLELISLSYHTDRKAFALDYFPALRTVARSEEQRAVTNCKRGNRFYNYLSTLGFSHRDAITQTACDILNINKDK